MEVSDTRVLCPLRETGMEYDEGMDAGVVWVCVSVGVGVRVCVCVCVCVCGGGGGGVKGG